MGHSEDDADHKIPHKKKTDCQNQLKISVLVQFNILYGIRYKKTDVILVQCPFKKEIRLPAPTQKKVVEENQTIIFSWGLKKT